MAGIPPPDRHPEIKHNKIFINNQFVNSDSNKTYTIYNPCNNEKVSDVQEGDKSDVDKAVQACRSAFKRGTPWRRMDASRRGHLLYRLADLMEKDVAYMALPNKILNVRLELVKKDAIMVVGIYPSTFNLPGDHLQGCANSKDSLETMDTGKPYKNSYQDMVHCVQILRYYAGWADKNMGESIPVDGDFFCYTRCEPVGVCGLLIPWNYPMLMMIWKMAPALACGNCMIVKPAEQTPLTALYCASLIKEAGFPPGVVNVIPGYGKTCGEFISNHAEINKVSFTGSTEIGMHIMQDSGKSNLKRCSMELSGKCPLVIFEDTDLDFAVQQAHEAAFNNMGQCRWSGCRTYVHENIYDEFVKRAVVKATNRKTGDPYEMDTEHGPQIDEEQYNKIMEYIKKGTSEGAQLKCGGKKLGDKGFYIEPTVFSDVSDNMKIARVEIFGPVQLIMKFSEMDEVIDRCNDTDYGMAAAIFTNDINRSMTFTHAMYCGTVWVNTYNDWFPQAPFGGYKKSGLYREMGKYALREYTEIKNIVYRIPQKNS